MAILYYPFLQRKHLWSCEALTDETNEKTFSVHHRKMLMSEDNLLWWGKAIIVEKLGKEGMHATNTDIAKLSGGQMKKYVK